MSSLNNFYKKNVHAVFEDSCYLTPEFASFARSLKMALNKDCKSCGLELITFLCGHFYVSAFLRNSVTGKIVYIDMGDVRAQICGKWSLDNVLYRSARDEKDYTGGHNMFAPLPQLLERVKALTER